MDLIHEYGVENHDGSLGIPRRLEIKPTQWHLGKRVEPKDVVDSPPGPTMSYDEFMAKADAAAGDPDAEAALAKEFFGDLYPGDDEDSDGFEDPVGIATGSSPEEEQGLGETGSEAAEEIGSTWSSEQRFSYAGLKASKRLKKTQSLFRDLSRQVTLLNWLSAPELAVKKFPFFIKSIKTSSKSKDQELKERKRIPELFCHPVSPSTLGIALPGIEKLPAWSKLPKQETRAMWLRELVTGLWFTSISTDDADPTPESWMHEPVGSHSGCLAFDLPEVKSRRFLTESPGKVGAFLKRYLDRRLETEIGSVDMAAVWRRSAVNPAAVTVFLFIRSACSTLGEDQFTVESEGRLHRSLIKHGIPIASHGPLRVEDPDHWLAFLTKLEGDVQRRDGGENVDDLADLDVENYDPVSGLQVPDDVISAGNGAHLRWRRYAERCHLPRWLSADTLMLMKDVLIHAQDLVKERKHLADRRAKRRHWKTKWTPADQSRLDVLVKAHASLDGVRLYRGSPAQLASMIYSSGEVLGEYCQSQHKAGCARNLYEAIRSAKST